MIAFSSGRAVPTMSAGGREEVREGRGGGGWRMEGGELSLLIRAQINEDTGSRAGVQLFT